MVSLKEKLPNVAIWIIKEIYIIKIDVKKEKKEPAKTDKTFCCKF